MRTELSLKVQALGERLEQLSQEFHNIADEILAEETEGELSNDDRVEEQFEEADKPLTEAAIRQILRAPPVKPLLHLVRKKRENGK